MGRWRRRRRSRGCSPGCVRARHFRRFARGEQADDSDGSPRAQKDAPSPFEDLVEMQCLWFIQEEGDAYAAKEDWARALRRYHQILDVSSARFIFGSSTPALQGLRAVFVAERSLTIASSLRRSSRKSRRTSTISTRTACASTPSMPTSSASSFFLLSLAFALRHRLTSEDAFGSAGFSASRTSCATTLGSRRPRRALSKCVV